jgi:hypothetical protein
MSFGQRKTLFTSDITKCLSSYMQCFELSMSGLMGTIDEASAKGQPTAEVGILDKVYNNLSYYVGCGLCEFEGI